MITYPTYFLDVQGIDYIIIFVHIFFEVILVSNINKERAVMIIVTYRATVLHTQMTNIFLWCLYKCYE